MNDGIAIGVAVCNIVSRRSFAIENHGQLIIKSYRWQSRFCKRRCCAVHKNADLFGVQSFIDILMCNDDGVGTAKDFIAASVITVIMRVKDKPDRLVADFANCFQ